MTDTAPFQAGIISVGNITAHPSNIGRDLGDLRELAASVAERGVLVPVVLEKHLGRYRLRDGHRRLAAARMAKVTRVPAIIHAEELDEKDWLLESVEYNEQRAGFSAEDRKRVALRLVELGVGRAGVAQAFGISAAKLGALLDGPKPAVERAPRPATTVSKKTLRQLLDEACQVADLHERIQLLERRLGEICR